MFGFGKKKISISSATELFFQSVANAVIKELDSIQRTWSEIGIETIHVEPSFFMSELIASSAAIGLYPIKNLKSESLFNTACRTLEKLIDESEFPNGLFLKTRIVEYCDIYGKNTITISGNMPWDDVVIRLLENLEVPRNFGPIEILTVSATITNLATVLNWKKLFEDFRLVAE